MLQTTGGAGKLSTLFNTCEALLPSTPANWLQSAMFSQNLMGWFMSTVQYDRRRGHHIVRTAALSPFYCIFFWLNVVDLLPLQGIPTVQDLCNIMLAPNTTPLANYAAVNDLFLQRQNSSCLDISYKNMIGELTNLTDFSGGRSWTWQTCQSFGYFQTTDAGVLKQPFGTLVPLKFYNQICDDAYGWTQPPNIKNTNLVTGGGKPIGATRILL